MNRRDFIIKTTGGAAAVSLSYSQLYAQIQKQVEPTSDQVNYDVIVLGVGSMGASACYHLAMNGSTELPIGFLNAKGFA
jgi:ribulose 1,5-bisphosphate synthetase/thiazole synthase